MNQIKDIPGITVDEISSLEGSDISSIDDLWQLVGNKEIPSVAEKVNMTPERLAALLVNQSVKEANEVEESFLRRNSMPLALLFVVFLLFLLLMRAIGIVPLLSPPTSRNLVVTLKPIPAYTVITLTDLDVVTKRTEKQGIEHPANVLGKLTLHALPKDSPIQKDQVSDLALPVTTLDEYELLSLPIKSETIHPALQTGEMITLLLDAHNKRRWQ